MNAPRELQIAAAPQVVEQERSASGADPSTPAVARCPTDASFRAEVAAELRATIETHKKAEEARWYANECFAGRCDEWIEWINPDSMRRALRELQQAVYLEPDEALLRTQLILSALIAEAARGHSERVAANGWPS